MEPIKKQHPRKPQLINQNFSSDHQQFCTPPSTLALLERSMSLWPFLLFATPASA